MFHELAPQVYERGEALLRAYSSNAVMKAWKGPEPLRRCGLRPRVVGLVGVYLPERVSPTLPKSPPLSLRCCLSRSLSASVASFSVCLLLGAAPDGHAATTSEGATRSSIPDVWTDRGHGLAASISNRRSSHKGERFGEAATRCC